MNSIFLLLLISLSSNAFVCANPNINCEIKSQPAIKERKIELNVGTSYIETKTRYDAFMNKVKAAIKDPEVFASIIKLPIRLSTEKGYVFIKDRKTLKKNHKALMRAGLGELFSEMPQSHPRDTICKYSGCGINRGEVWFTAYEENGPILIFSIHREITPIKGLTPINYNGIKALSKNELKVFFKKRGISTKDITFYSDSYIQDRARFQVYKADINNDKRNEFIVTYIQSGSGNFSGISVIYVEDKGRLSVMEITNLKASQEYKSQKFKHKRAKAWKENLPEFEFSNFHSHLGDPFLFIKDGKTMMNFTETGANLAYIWLDNIVSPVEMY